MNTQQSTNNEYFHSNLKKSGGNDAGKEYHLNVQTGVGLPAAYINQQTAKSYAYELRLTSDRQALQQSQIQSPVQPRYYLQNQVNYVPQTSTSQPLYKDIDHEQQPIKVITREDIEGPWRTKCSQLEKQVHDLQSENKKYRGMNLTTEKVTYIEDTGRVNQLSSEVDRLNRVLIDLNNEIETWRARYSSLEKQISARGTLEMEMERMKKVSLDTENIMQVELNRLREQAEDWQKRYKVLEASVAQARLHEVRAKDAEIHILNLQSDLKKTELTLRSKEDEYENLKEKYQRLERLLRESENQQLEIQRLRNIIDDRNREIEKMREGSTNRREVEGKVSLLKVELDRLTNLIASKDEEIQVYKHQLMQIGPMDNKSQFLEIENQRYKEQLSYQENELNQLRQKFQYYNKQEEKITFLANEIDQWKKKYGDLQEQLNQKEMYIDALNKEFDQKIGKKEQQKSNRPQPADMYSRRLQ